MPSDNQSKQTQSSRSGGSRSGNSGGGGSLGYTVEEVKNGFKCEEGFCVICPKRKDNTCKKESATKCTTFVKRRTKALELKFPCPKTGKLCSKKCESFSACLFETKKNYVAWLDAYNKGNKEVLTRIMRGGK